MNAERLSEDVPHVRRNFSALIADPACYNFGFSFFDTATVLPVLLLKLGASDGQIGFLVAVINYGWMAFALVGSHAIHGKATHKTYLVAWNAATRVGFFLIPLVVAVYGLQAPRIALWVIMGHFLVFGLGRGLTIASWYDMIAKTIPEKVRGRFFGTQTTCTALTGLLGSLLVMAILKDSSLVFPTNFVILGMFGTLGLIGSTLALVWIKEIPGALAHDEDQAGLWQYLRRVGPMLRETPSFVRLILTRVLLEGGALAIPFYAIYANRTLGMPLYMVGLFSLLRSLGRMTTSAPWGLLIDRIGATRTMRLAGMIPILPPLLALSARWSPWLLIVAFAVMGIGEAGVGTSYSNRLLRAVGERNRPMALGVANIGLAPLAAYGYIGALLLGGIGYPGLFLVAATIAGCGAIWAARQ